MHVRGMSCVAALALVTAVACGPAPPPTPAPIAAPQVQPKRTLTALAGAGQDTKEVMGMFPRALRVRAGDTVTWKINSDEIHTVSFTAGMKEIVNPVPLQNGDSDEMIPWINVPLPGG